MSATNPGPKDKAPGLGLNINTAWWVLLAWVVVELVIFVIVRSWNLVSFTVIFGFGFGWLAWRYRKAVRPAFRRAGLDNVGGFLLLAFWISVFEEVLCYSLGNRIANPILWEDIVQVCLTWLFWFATWYLYIAKRYAFSDKEALLTGALVGVLYECVSSGAIFGNPFAVLMAPLVVVIYAAMFVLPLQLVDLKGKDKSRWKYLVGVLLPYLASLPMGLILVFILPT